jgi:hypothetical protein
MRFKDYLQEAKSRYDRSDLNKLPQPKIDEIEKLIRDGAKDLEQKWANALELVHKAYEVAQVQRPTPDMNDAWKQYETMLSLAVKNLAKHRGRDGDWRMSSAIFREFEHALSKLIVEADKEQQTKFTISSEIDELPLHTTVTADTMDEVLNPILRFNITGHEVEIKHRSPNHAVVHFVKNGERTGRKITIKKVKS